MRVKRFVLIGALLIAGLAAGCSSTKAPAETSETVVPYWIDGVALCASRMIDKNDYWIDKFRKGKATPEDLVRILESNSRFYRGLNGRLDAYKYCAALAREEMLAQQKEED